MSRYMFRARDKARVRVRVRVRVRARVWVRFRASVKSGFQVMVWGFSSAI